LRERRRAPYIGEQQAQGMNLDVMVKALSYCRSALAGTMQREKREVY
jgi:hypothetical protein